MAGFFFMFGFCAFDDKPTGLDFGSAPRGTVFYDSNGNFFRANASAAGGFNDLVEDLFGASGGTQDMSTDGQYLLQSLSNAVGGGGDALIDDVTDTDFADWTRTADYDTLYAALTSDADTSNVVYFFGGTNDANASSGVTKAKYKQGLLKLKEFIQADFVNVKAIILNRVGAIGAGNDTNAQIVREALIELPDEDDFFIKGIDYYDQPRTDNAHPTTAAFQTNIAVRQSQNLGRHGGKITTGGFGASVTAATFEHYYVDLTITHDSGNALFVDSGCEDVFALDVGGTIYQPSLVTKLSNTSLRLSFEDSGLDPADITAAKIGYGAMAGLTQARPEAVRDNAGYALQSSSISVAQADPLIGMDFSYDMDAALSDKTFSGDDVTAITERGGNSFTSASGYYGTYDSYRKAVFAPDITTAYEISAGATGSASHLFTVAFYVPATVGNQGVIIGFGNATSVQAEPRTSLLIDTNKDIQWYQNQTNGFEVIGRAVTGWNIVVLDFVSASVCNAYLNDAAVHTFDPRDNMATQTHVWFLGGNHSGATATDAPSGVGVGRVWGRFGVAHGAEGDASISSIITYLTNLYAAQGEDYALPAGLSFTPPYNIYKHADGTFSHDYEPREITGTTKHVDPTNGNNANDGNSFATAYKSTDTAKAAGANIIIVYPVATGTLTFVDRSEGMTTDNFARSTKIIAMGNPGDLVFDNAIKASTLTWSQVGSNPTYSATRASVELVHDIGVTQESVFWNQENGGVHPRSTIYQKLGSVGEVHDTPGSWHLSGSTLYVHALDGEQPDANIRVRLNDTFISQTTGLDGTTPLNFWLENITSLGKDMVRFLIADNVLNDTHVTAIGCVTYNDTNVDGNSLSNVAMFYSKNSVVYQSASDGMNYRSGTLTPQCYFLEDNTFTNFTGDTGGADNYNGSTAHNSVKGVRMNCYYKNAYGAIIHDIDTTETLSLNTTVENNLSVSPTGGTDCGFRAGGSAKVFLDGCTTLGEMTYDLTADNTSEIIVVADFNGVVGSNFAGTGTITYL